MTWDKPALSAAFNIGPDPEDSATVEAVVTLAQNSFGKGTFVISGDEAKKHEAVHLALDNSKALRELGISPRWKLAMAVQRTMAWYRQFNEGASAAKLCNADIDAFEAAS